MSLCCLVHILLNCFKKLCCLCLYLVESNLNLLSGIATHKDTFIVLDILWSDFDTERNTAHLTLIELPSRALVGIIDFHAEALFK